MSIRASLNWVELLQARARGDGARAAFTFLDDGLRVEAALTFSQLDMRARAIAFELRKTTAIGDRAVLLYPAGLDFVAAFFGCLYAGVIAVPIALPQNDRKVGTVNRVLTDCGSSQFLSTEKTQRQFAPAIDAACGGGAAPIRWLLTDRIAAAAISWQSPPSGPDTIAYLQYTSGSTSDPKGVIIDHGAVTHQCAGNAQVWAIDEKSAIVSWMPHFHDFGLVFGILQAVYNGCHSVLMSPLSFTRRPLNWLLAISRYGATHSGAPNFAYDHCIARVKEEELAGLKLGTWAVAINGAEPVRRRTLEDFFEKFSARGVRFSTFCPGFGLAEAVLRVTSSAIGAAPIFHDFGEGALAVHRVAPPSAGETGKSIPGCGAAASNTRIAIVDPKTLEETDQVGEIWVQGPSVGKGYWNRPEESLRTFGALLPASGDGPFLRTGDLGCLRDGELFVTGRLKDLIVIRGANHYPQDLEAVVGTSHALLRQGHCVATSVERDGVETLVVVAERVRYWPQALDFEDVFGAIRNRVFKTFGLDVGEILIVKTASLPFTSSGKIQRQLCRQEYLSGNLAIVERRAYAMASTPTDSSQHSAPRDATPRPGLLQLSVRGWFVTWIAKSQKLPQADIDTSKSLSFYGLDSMKLLDLHQALEKWLGCAVRNEMLFDAGSIDEIIVSAVETKQRKGKRSAAPAPALPSAVPARVE